MYISRKAQTSCKDYNDCFSFSMPMTPCTHSFSVKCLLSKCSTVLQEKKFLKHFTGFDSHSEFTNSLNFILPGQDRTQIVYKHTAAAKSRAVDPSKLFGSDSDGEQEKMCEPNVLHHRLNHKLCVEDEFLLVLMKLRMGLSDIDLSLRFCVSDCVVNEIFRPE